MQDQNNALVRRVIEQVWNQGNFDVVERFFSDDYAGQVIPGDASRGPETVRQYFAAQREALPDIHYEIEEQIADGDQVVTRWTARATHTGEFMGIPPTGKPGTVAGVTINRIASGTIVEGWTIFDALGLMQQLGVISAPATAGRRQADRS